jgi:hypothetical protein
MVRGHTLRGRADLRGARSAYLPRRAAGECEDMFHQPAAGIRGGPV